MQEKGPEFKIVGNLSEEEKRFERKRLQGFLGEEHLSEVSEEHLEKLKSLEYPMTPEQLEIFRIANKGTNQDMRKVGVKPHAVPANNFHIIPSNLYEEFFPESSSSSALTEQKQQAVFLDADIARMSLFAFAYEVYHEMSHLKHCFVLEVQKDEKKKELQRSIYRTGLSMSSSQKLAFSRRAHEHFRGLNEAVIARQGKKFIEKIRYHPLFVSEREWMESPEVQKKVDEIAKDLNMSEDEKKEIFWVSKSGKDYVYHSYFKQRQVLQFVLDEILKLFPEKYKNQEQVFLEFSKAAYTGRVLPLSDIVNETFGKGGFRLLGMMKTDEETPIEVFEALRKKRLEQEKKKIYL